MHRLRPSILVVLVLTACVHRTPAPTPVEGGGYRFACPVRGGGKVYLVGDFNQWRHEPMTRDGAWAEKVVALRPGAYAYACAYAGGSIEAPPEAPAYVDDGFGGRNGFLVVPKVTQADAAASNR